MAYVDSLGKLGDAVTAILVAIAKRERVRMSERVLAGLAHARGAQQNQRMAAGV